MRVGSGVWHVFRGALGPRVGCPRSGYLNYVDHITGAAERGEQGDLKVPADSANVDRSGNGGVPIPDPWSPDRAKLTHTHSSQMESQRVETKHIQTFA